MKNFTGFLTIALVFLWTQAFAQPSNDNCSSAVTVGALPWTSAAFDITLATTAGDPPAPSCQSNLARSVWFQFTPTTTGNHYISTCQSDAAGSTVPDIVLGVYTSTGGCSGPFTPVVCDDDGCTTLGNQSLISSAALTGGTTYYIVAWQYCLSGCSAPSAGAENIQLYVAPPPSAPANDDCAGALSVTVNSGTTCTSFTSGTVVGATASTGPSSTCGTYDDDVWFSFVATSVVHNIAIQNVTGSATDMTHQVLSSCGAPTALVCSDPNTSTVGGLTVGQTYYIRVASFTSTGGQTSSFQVCVTTPPPPPANDECSGALSVTVNSGTTCTSFTNGSVQSSTASAGPSSTCGTYDDDVWFSFVATSLIHNIAIQNVTGSTTDMTHQVLSSCGAPTALVCSDPNTSTVSGLTVGQTYFIRVATWSSTGGQTSAFEVCVTTPPNMTYVSSTTTQVTGASGAGSVDQQTIRIDVTVINQNTPLSISSFSLNTNGSSVAADISNAKIYYTGTSTTFSTANLFGSFATPSGSFTINGSQALTGGTTNTVNYFWLAYDLTCSAAGPNLDGECNSFVIGVGSQAPTVQAPANNRTVTALSSYSTAANGNWNSPSTWLCGIPPSNTTIPININHNVTLDANVDVQSTVTVAANRTLTINANTLSIGNGGTGVQNLSISGTVSVGGGTLNVGTSTGVSTSNITVASSGTLSISSGTINLGPTGGYLRSLSNSGTLTVAGGIVNVNGSVSISSTFNQSGGDIIIDGNGGTAGSSVAASTAMLSMTSGAGTTTGGTITIVDPNFNSGSGKAVDYNVSTTARTWATAHILNIGDGVSTQSSSNTSGFILESYTGTGRLTYGTLNIKGGSITNRWVSLGAWSINVGGTMTVDAGSEIRLSSASTPPVFVGNIVNNGTITSTVALSLAAISGNSVVVNPNPQTISGSGVWRNLTTSPTANLNGLTVNNSNSNPISIPASMISGTGTGSVSGTLTLTSGKLDIGATPITLGISTGTNGTLTGGSATSYIIGEMRRWIGTTTGSRPFPIGTSTTYRPATINFTGAQTTGGVISASFGATAPTTTGLPIAAEAGNGGVAIEALSPNGFWQVERISGSGGTYTATFDASSFTQVGGAPISNFANVKIVKRSTAGSWAAGADGTSSAIANAAGLATAARTGCTSFSIFALGGTNAALPIELKLFTGKVLEKSNLLQWETASESNVQSHSIERSKDGSTDWTVISTQPSKGESRRVHAYSAEDIRPLAKSYYRLRTVDFDGRYQISKVISLSRELTTTNAISVFPSPTSDKVSVQFIAQKSGDVNIQVLDLTGRVVLTQQLTAVEGLNNSEVSLNSLPSGTYILNVKIDSQVTEPVRVIKL
jgi:hypothetical protein